MQREFIAPFVAGLGETFRTMLGCGIRPASISEPPDAACFEITGVIGLGGNADGSLVLRFSREVALRAASAMLMVETDELNADVIDAVGEITNMVAGSGKAKLEEFGIRIGLPSVVTGKLHQVNFSSQVLPVVLNFESDWGLLSLAVGFAIIEEPVPA